MSDVSEFYDEESLLRDDEGEILMEEDDYDEDDESDYFSDSNNICELDDDLDDYDGCLLLEEDDFPDEDRPVDDGILVLAKDFVPETYFIYCGNGIFSIGELFD